MNKILAFIISLFCLNNSFGQTIHDSVFNNVILIKDTDVSTNGCHFLIDIPIKPKKEPIVVFNKDFRISTKLFFSRNSFLYGQNEIILITPDWEFLKKIEEEERKFGIEIKAYRNKIYHIKRSGSEYEIDSSIIALNDPRGSIKINFKKPELNENEEKYFFRECYGHYPKDSNIELQRERNVIKNNFNKKHHVNVYKNTYRQIMSEEGEYCEYCDYYTLSDLTNKQKIEFLFPSKPYTETDDISQGYCVIILPSVINTEKMGHINQ